MARRPPEQARGAGTRRAAGVLLALALLHTAAAANRTTAPAPRRALLDASPPSCKVLALPCVASVLTQASSGLCAGPASFTRDNTCCPIVRDFVAAGCACDGAFLAVASFGGWNGVKMAQAVSAILSTPCGRGLKDPSCLQTCPPPKAAAGRPAAGG